MTVQRIEFADHGQDFLWWEIDTETGRVVGCGPFQAGIWADGKHSVDLTTVRVGQRPRHFFPQTSPEGAVLKYAITAIKPAPQSGGGVASMTDLTRLIDAVNIRLAQADGIDTRDFEGWDRFVALGTRLIQELRDEHGARIRLDREPATMRLGGVTTSATGGWAALLRNWQSAARRRVAQKEAQ